MKTIQKRQLLCAMTAALALLTGCDSGDTPDANDAPAPVSTSAGVNHSQSDPCNIKIIRFVKTFPCVAVYMSSLTNMAIAVDRYRVIVTSQSLQVIHDLTY